VLKVAKKDNTESNFSQTNSQEGDVEVEFEEFSHSHSPTAPNLLPAAAVASRSASQDQPVASTSKDHRPAHNKVGKSKKKELDDIEREILTELKKTKPSAEPRSEISTRTDNEMLLSFLPYIRDMQETELMDLQMEILTTIKKIKQKRTFPTPRHMPAGSYRSPYHRNNTNSSQSAQHTFTYHSPSPTPSPVGCSTSAYQSSESCGYQSPSSEMSYHDPAQAPSQENVNVYELFSRCTQDDE
jgi:hypothetical protein